MTAPRLPIPGEDDGTWGNILNSYLQVEHTADGTLKLRTDGTFAPLSNGKVPTTNLGAGAASAANYLRGDGTWAIPNSGSSTLASNTDVTLTSPATGQVLTYDMASSKWKNQPLPASVASVAATDATITISGSSTAPTIGVAAIPESKVTNLTTDLAAKANASSLATVATSGSYADLTSKPTIPVAGTGASNYAVGNDSRITGAEQTVNKGSASGYAGLNSSGLVPTAQLGTATASSSTFLRGDGSWSTPASAANATAGAPGLVQLSGDLGGTATAPTVPGLAGKANTAAVLSNVIRPLGGSSNDAAAINTVLSSLDAAGGGTVILHSPGSYFRIETALKVGSNTSLVLWDCELRRIADGAGASTTNSNVITNLHMNSTGDSKIRVRGIGRALVNGQASLQTRNTTSVNNNFGLFWVNVTDLAVQDITIGPTQAFASNIQVCTKVRYINIQLDQDRSTVNQDGLDIGPGCSDVVFDGVTGTTGDDGFSLYAQNTSGSLHAYTKTLTASQRNCSDITIRNIKLDVGINPVRIQAGDSSTMTNVTIENFVNLRRSYASVTGGIYTMLAFGHAGYVTTPPAVGDIAGITFRGYKGCAPYLITTDDTYSDVTIDGVELQASTDSTTWTALVGYNGFTAYTGTITNIAIRNVRSHVPASLMTSGYGYVCAVAAGTANNISFDNLHLLSARCLTKNSVAVTNLHLGFVSVATLNSALYASSAAETGRAAAPQVGTYVSTAKYIGVATGLRLEPSHPILTTSDTFTPAPTAGSYLSATGVDLTGGSTTTAAVYVADGTGWNRFVTLGGASGVAPTAPTGLTATGALGTINLSWTASSSGSPTSYALYRGTASGSETLLATSTITGTTYSDSSVTAGTTYYYKVAGVNGSGTGTQSSEASAASSSAGTVGFTDTFNRTGSTSGSNWATLGTATFPTNGSQMGIANTSTSTAATYINAVTSAAYSATATNVYAQIIAAVSGTSTTGAIPAVIINYTDDSNYYFGYFSYTSGSTTAGTYSIYKCVSGTSTSLVATSTVSAPTLPVTIRLQNSSNTLTLYVNGVSTLTTTDSSLSGVRVGTRWRGGGATGANTASEAQKLGTFTAGTVS